MNNKDRVREVPRKEQSKLLLIIMIIIRECKINQNQVDHIIYIYIFKIF